MSVTHLSLKLRCLSAFTPCAFALLEFCISQFSRNLVIRLKPLQFYMETYRSGHNGADSKSVREQSPASSNLAVSANGTLENPVFSRVFSIFKIFLHGVFYNFCRIFWRVLRLKILLENRTKSPWKPHKTRLFSRRCTLGC